MSNVSKYASEARVPGAQSKVYKDECVYSFQTQESDGGLYVSLNDWTGMARKFIPQHSSKTNSHLYLNMRRIKIELPPPTQEEPPLKKPTILAIGVEGGFAADATAQFEDHHSLYCVDGDVHIPLPDPSLPDQVQMSIKGIIEASSASRQDDIQAWVADQLVPTKLAENLVQLANPPRIPPSGYVCGVSGCNKNTENLWMNLTDGYIGCGKSNWDGSGGNGHALKHYEDTGYPLSVKLGTITPEGTADVYSYPEDNMVNDPLLEKHLAHFGIMLAQMRKTEKTLAEMDLDTNLSYEFSRIQERGKVLQHLYGPGLTGIENLGNSCYLSSVLQVLFSVPEFQERYFKQYDAIVQRSGKEPAADLELQLAKLGYGLLSGEYSVPEAKGPGSTADEKEKEQKEFAKASQVGIAPKIFKYLIGRGHPEFSTMRQQDALELFQHLISLIDRMERAKGSAASPTSVFELKFEDRLMDTASGMVRYSSHTDNIVSLNIPLDKATNTPQVREYEERVKALPAGQKVKEEEVVRAHVPLSACLDAFVEPEGVPGFISPVTNQPTVAVRTTKFATFPDVLVLHMKRFVVGENWAPKKLDVTVDVPDQLDLEAMRGKGQQPGENLLPEDAKVQEAEVVADEAIVSQLMEMGFPRIRCEKAAINTNNQNPDAAMTWLFSHMEDADIDEPIPKKQAAKGGDVAVSEDAIEMIMGMGFTRPQALKALKNTGGSAERAADWLFSHTDELDTMDAESTSSAPAPSSSQGTHDGPGRYTLFGMVSHIGSSTTSGHYVCHVRKDDKWVLFNDREVALSEAPPKEMAYIYFYRRV
eukprot:TRINITY_DN2903_c0_g1_i1.p1 TRINITY_DN2903_c0_g1~~TRINITY_DN2903_c0_g1_i1.p1  ORF type:complete len:823 (+),score=301.92 TRINITY_DN2903_c0_g1_i1:23-2470(+)